MTKPNSAAPSAERETKRVLGRGLSALIPASNRPPEPALASPAQEESNGLRFIPLVRIALNPYQPREEFSPERLEELTESIKQHGVLQPIVVRPKGKSSFELVAGERRFRAASQAGLKEIPAVVKEIDDKTSLAIALIENIQRQELNPVESARAYQRLLSEFSLTQTELAQEIGKSQPTIANSLRLLALPDTILESLSGGNISEGHAKVILSVETETDKIALWKAIVKGSLSVRESERRAAATKASIPRGITASNTSDLSSDIENQRLEQELSLTFGTKAKIRFSGNDKGQIEIQFYGAEQLEGLLQKLISSSSG